MILSNLKLVRYVVYEPYLTNFENFANFRVKNATIFTQFSYTVLQSRTAIEHAFV